LLVIRAVVFDFDGLILDTETPSFEAWCATFAAYGCEPLGIDEWALEVGTVGGLDVVALLRDRSAREVDEDAVQIARRAHRDRLLTAEAARPGVESWLDEANAIGLGLAVASSSEYEWVDPHLRRLGLRERFAHLSCYAPGVGAKPAPDTYLSACAALDVEPAQALAVEDSPNGIAAAKAAGLRCVAVPNPVTARLDLARADLRLDSLSERSLSEVLAHFDARSC
jgi:HAD superfamily hydrolase (TIGR01509 family)